ncbi:MAG: GIY-YIG nuclease family protein, partial [Pacificimonas sp.]
MIVSNMRNGTIYIGVTSDLARRAYEHREKLVDGFTKRRNCTRLVWYGEYPTIEEAIAAEHRMKQWNRKWKLRVIE